MQFRFFTISFATVISASSVLADSNENGDSISCQVTAHIAQNTERNPTCHNGQGTIITTYPGTSFEERVKTVGDIAVNNGVCTVIIYPATSYPAVTATLPPCENSGEGVSNCQTIFIAQNTPRNPDCHTGQGKIVTTYSGTSFSEWRTTSIEADRCKIVVYPATSYPAVIATLTPCDGVEANDGSNPTTRIDADGGGNSEATTRIDADEGSDPTTSIDADEKINCRTIVIPYNIPLPPTCHSGKNTVTKTYPPRHLTESRSTSFNAVGSKNFHPDNCAVIIYPATTYSASTAVLPPCKKSNFPNVVGVKGCPLVTRVQSPHRPMCHRGTKTITRVYPATSMRAKVSTSFKNTLLRIYDPNSCTKIFYPATFYPASTVTLKPCAKTVTRQPTRPFRISCVKKGSNPNRLAFATRVRRKSYISNDVVVIEPAKVFPRTTKKFPFCP